MVKPLSPDTLVYDFTPANDPQISPDGTRIIYALGKTDRESKQAASQLWICDIDGGNARQLTRSGERNGGGRWSPDGRQIAFVSDRVGEKRRGIFVMPAGEGGEARELTRHGMKDQDIGDLAWSPDGARIAYTTAFDPENPEEREPDEDAAPKVRVTRRIDYKQDNRGYLGDKRTQVFVVEVASGERRQLTRDPVDHNFPQWSPDGARLAVQVPNRNGMNSQLALVEVASGAKTMVGPERGVVGHWSWSPRGDRIAFAGDTEQTWQLDYFVHDVASGETRRLTDDLQALPVTGFPTIAPPSQPVWLDERQVLFHAVRAGGSTLQVIDIERGSVEPVTSWRALNVGQSVDDARRYVVQAYTSLDAFGEVSVYDTRSDATKVITRYSEPVFAERPPATWERFDVRRGAFTIEAWLLKPPDFDEAKRYPVILDVHGGPNGFYGYSFNPIQQCFATNGFLVVFANPRGSSSYGRHFTLQVARDWGGEDFGDLMAVVDAVLERPYADPERTGIFGYSYGGYMTAWTIGQTDRFKAAVSRAPVFDLESFYGTSDIGYTWSDLQFGGPPHENAEWYAAHSPSTFAHRARTPTLIIHGETDAIPMDLVEEWTTALPHARLIKVPGASHFPYVERPDMVWPAIEDFLRVTPP
jgi:dipeptidyl aminopeptidase/acylaminoacyl peptidase